MLSKMTASINNKFDQIKKSCNDIVCNSFQLLSLPKIIGSTQLFTQAVVNYFLLAFGVLFVTTCGNCLTVLDTVFSIDAAVCCVANVIWA